MKTAFENDRLLHFRTFSPHLGSVMETAGGSGGGGSRDSNRGSYELYDDQRAPGKLAGEPPTNRPSPNVGQAAPGCPGSLSESTQKVEELERQLMDMKLREDKLLQIISDLRSAHGGHTSNIALDSAPFLNMDGATGSPSSESVGENVKDARMKYLQRQVTVLQANMYKAEGWGQRATEAMKERDKAVDECRLTSGQLAKALQENESLRQELSKLNAGYLELQQKLRLTMQELDTESRHERCQSQAAKLQEEVTSLRSQFLVLKESSLRLSQENKGLRELTSNSGPGSSQSPMSGNSACSQELEYLHSVVDMLKTTVLEQRNFLVSMKVPQQSFSGQTRRPALNGLHDNTSHLGLQLTRDQVAAMSKSASAALGSEYQQIGSPMVPNSSKAASSVLSMFSGQGDTQQLRANGMPVMEARSTAGGSHRALADPISSAQGEQNVPKSFTGTAPLATSGPGAHVQRQLQGSSPVSSPMGSSHNMKMQPTKTTASTREQSQAAQAAQLGRISGGSGVVPQSSASSVAQNVNVNGTTDTLLAVPSGRKISSEILAYRQSPDQGLNINHGGSKSDILQRNQNKLATEGKNFPNWLYSSTSGYGYQQGSAPGGGGSGGIGQFQATGAGKSALAVAGLSGHSPVAYEGAMMLPEQEQGVPSPRHNVSSAVQTASSQDPHASAVGNHAGGVPQGSHPSAQQQHIYRPPMLFADNASSLRLANVDMKSGGLMAATPGSSSAVSDQRPPSHSGLDNGQKLQEWLSGPTPASGGGGRTGNRDGPPIGASPAVAFNGGSFESAVEPPRAHLNSDRICPVCSKDYSEVSMEDFQTHVFECFDDENTPETMRPEVSLDRTCPMCNGKFSQEMSQQDFEAHVHSHFGEEVFTLLQP
ncbi:uncharacterized protein LOC101859288 [Aplysia californica]|uniref:Uncharacterized protein LOC101859288 n=1 Tax=Aplysia californica TaxID=6500 RepID=A0ABM1AD02_APLCA|nr:uncharacterized protein LOC101859288 [Aplysia californica]